NKSIMKRTNHLSVLTILVSFLFWQCGQQQTTEDTVDEIIPETQAEEPSLKQLWETPAELTTCESVLYDESSGTIYVANIEGEAAEKDGKGSISIISKEGEIQEREWVNGLNAPKGMGIMDGKLYVTDIDEVVEIEIESKKITNRYPV